MDGLHDLGGREGFGPVRWQDDRDDEMFHEDWEARAWAITFLLVLILRQHPTWSLDWFRFVVERIDPVDYLTRPYYDRWVQTAMAIMIDDGHATVDEFVAGKSSAPAKLPTGDRLPKDKASEAPLYAVGDPVRPKMLIDAIHTRRPGYVRGHGGEISAYHGLHPLADGNAQGRPVDEHLYTVAFRMSDLWPEETDARDRVYVDLWESYLERL